MMLNVTPASGAPSPRHRTAVFFARIVMPFSRSRSPESIARSSTCWCSPNAPDCQSILSTRVVLPWSTWATMATLRMSARVFMGMRNSLSGFRRCFGPRRRGSCDGSHRGRHHGVASWSFGGGSGWWVRRTTGAEHPLERLHDGQVGRQPGHRTQLLEAQPAQLVVVLDRLGRALDDFDEPHQHLVALAQRPGGPGPRTRHVGTETYADAELFEELPVQGHQGRLPL